MQGLEKRLGLERLGLDLGLAPEIKGLDLISVSRKFWKVSVSVSDHNVSYTSLQIWRGHRLIIGVPDILDFLYVFFYQRRLRSKI